MQVGRGEEGWSPFLLAPYPGKLAPGLLQSCGPSEDRGSGELIQVNLKIPTVIIASIRSSEPDFRGRLSHSVPAVEKFSREKTS